MSWRTSAPSPNRLEMISRATLWFSLARVYDEKSREAVLLSFADANFVTKEPVRYSFDSRYAHETIQHRYRGHELHLREQAAVMTDIFVDVFIIFKETKGLGHR
jgi:hypothetical protein